MGSEALRSMTDIASGHSERLSADGLVADGRRQPHIGPFRIPGIPAYIDPKANGLGRQSATIINTPHSGTMPVRAPAPRSDRAVGC